MHATPLRRPAVAGRFYPARPEALSRDLDSYLKVEGAAGTGVEEVAGALACVVPHAGYMYSGRVAGEVYRRLPARSSCVILGPNHFGRGAPLALVTRGAWLTPLGAVPIDTALAEAIGRHCHLLTEDAAAHAEEHSLEVQLPFLQRRFPKISVVPIAVGVGLYAALESLGQGVAGAIQELERGGQAAKPALIVASSDLNHYEPDGITRIKDRKAIDRILELDARGLYEVVHREDISMCGFGPTVAMLIAAKALGARQAELLKYATSADAGGELNAVVGYAGIILS